MVVTVGEKILPAGVMKPGTVKLCFDARAEVVAALDRAAADRELSRSDVLRAAVRDYLKGEDGDGRKQNA